MLGRMKVELNCHTILWQYVFKTGEYLKLAIRCSHSSLKTSLDHNTRDDVKWEPRWLSPRLVSVTQFSLVNGAGHILKFKEQWPNPNRIIFPPSCQWDNRAPNHIWDKKGSFASSYSIFQSHSTYFDHCTYSFLALWCHTLLISILHICSSFSASFSGSSLPPPLKLKSLKISFWISYLFFLQTFSRKCHPFPRIYLFMMFYL